MIGTKEITPDYWRFFDNGLDGANVEAVRKRTNTGWVLETEKIFSWRYRSMREQASYAEAPRW